MSDNYSVQDLQDNLDYLNETKRQIKNAIINKGQTIGASDTFRSYADKIEAIQTSEDLDTELNAQDQIIEDIKTSLNNKGGAGLALNIFAQTEEPDIKKGIWLQTDKQVDNIIQDENVFVSEQWNTTKNNNLRNLPATFSYGTLAKVGNYVYLFHVGSGTTYYDYKYNVLTDAYTQIATLNVTYSQTGHAIAYGTDIYILSSASNSSTSVLYKYDTLTDTYTRLSDVPLYSSRLRTAAVLYQSNIYLFAGTYICRYDILTDTSTMVTPSVKNNFPVYDGQFAISGDTVYFFGSTGQSGYATKAVKYNITNNAWSSISATPTQITAGYAVAYENNIYLFGSANSSGTNYGKYCYKYNIINNTYTQLTDVPKTYAIGTSILIDTENGKEAYLFGGNGGSYVQVMTLLPKSYDRNNAIILSQNSDYKYTTELVESDVINGLQYEFNDVYYYTQQDGLDNSIPTYYGNGTQWIKFKN